MPLKIIGAGFGRTGTNSLRIALNMLGAGPTYHMHEVRYNAGHKAMWHGILNGVAPDWELVFRNYAAAVDWPITHYWLQLVERFPSAKVILTVRDPESWYTSFSRTIYRAVHLPITEDMSEEDRLHRRTIFQMIDEETFSGKSGEKDHVIDVFNRRIAEVIDFIPPQRLLIYDVTEGWEPLCRFLGVSVPKTPFPRTNSTREFLSQAPERFKPFMEAHPD